VDQWDWERVITSEQRNLQFLKEIVSRIWKVLVGAEMSRRQHPDQLGSRPWLEPKLKQFRSIDTESHATTNH
jgi:asparagine synthetase A